MFVRYDQKDLAASPEKLGGKGAGLVWMKKQGVNVPPALILPTDVCIEYMKNPKKVMKQIAVELPQIKTFFKETMGYMPLVSVRSGARVSMPGMMDTILNVGLDAASNEEHVKRLGSACVQDCHKRLVTMYGNVVMGLDRKELEQSEDPAKLYAELTNEVFPETKGQLLGSIQAVFESWNNERAVYYRKMHSIPNEWGTAVVIQAMVFGNMNDKSATGVMFTRNLDSGEAKVVGEFLVNAQGEDVVAGIRTPESLEKMPDWNDAIGQELLAVALKLEDGKKDVQDVEFTVQDGKLYVLQTRNAKRSAKAAIRIAVEMVEENMIDVKTAIKRVSVRDLDIAQMSVIDPKFKKKHDYQGIEACSGVVTGKPVFTAQAAIDCKEPCILITDETTPDDIAGMHAAVGVLTMKGGATSHAAVVARGMNRACIVGLGVESIVFKSVEKVSIDGETGRVWCEAVPVIVGSKNEYVKKFIDMVMTKMNVVPVVQEVKGTYDSVVLDLGGEFDVEQAKTKIIAAVQKVKSLYVDVRKTGREEAEATFGRMFFGEMAIEEMMIKSIETLPKAVIQGKMTLILSDGMKSSLPTIGSTKDLKSLVLAKGMVTMEGQSDEATKKVLEWKKADGVEIVAIGSYMEGAKSLISIEQVMQLQAA